MNIKSKIKEYRLELVSGALGRRDELLGALAFDRVYYFVDDAFYRRYESDLKRFIGNDVLVRIEARETHKTYAKLGDYYKVLIEKGFTRNDLLVTFGGGILQDISGFIASTLYRGIKWMYFPTTLLAQADSCIGSKTSINFEDSKNLIGTFYPPDLIYLDTGFCASLSDADFNSGLGEIIKFHLLSGPEHFVVLQEFLRFGDLRRSPFFQKTILSTLEIKRSYFEADEFDSGRRNLLNYGHCFGHALESASDFAISHGEAVMVGMGFANSVALKRGLMTHEAYGRFDAVLRPYYPRFDWSRISVEEIIHFMRRDKKRVGKDLTMILAYDIGQSGKLSDIQEDEVRSAYEEFTKNYPVKDKAAV